jgi:hypothetical protein
LFFGPEKGCGELREDISAYTVADGATVYLNEQPRPKVSEEQIERITYEEEPVIARRVVLVDPCGDIISEDNPLPTTATLSVGGINIDLNSETGDTVGIGAHENSLYDQSDASITTENFEEIYTYTSTSNGTRISHIEVTVGAPAIVVVKIGTNIIRTRRTSPSERNANFSFHEHRRLTLGQTISVEAQVVRKFCPDYDCFTALEGYIRS